MGFLLGAYGKLMAGKRVRNLQYRMTQIQQRAARVTREVGDMEKRLNRMEQFATQNLRLEQMPLQFQMQQSMYALGGMLTTEQMTEEQKLARQAQQQAYMNMQQDMANAQNALMQNFEYMREMMLQPLKDEEDALETEKANLESQIKLAQQDYEAMKDMEKQGAQNMKPDYTGQS